MMTESFNQDGTDTGLRSQAQVELTFFDNLLFQNQLLVAVQ